MDWFWLLVILVLFGLLAGPDRPVREGPMTPLEAGGLIVSVALFFYLLVALLAPEKFQ